MNIYFNDLKQSELPEVEKIIFRIYLANLYTGISISILIKLPENKGSISIRCNSSKEAHSESG